MQLTQIYRRIAKEYNFEIICIQGVSPTLKNIYSYGAGSNKLSKDFKLGQPNGKNFFLSLGSIVNIDKFEEHFKSKGYSYIVLEYFIEDKSYHKVTRSSNIDSLGLTSLQIKNKKLLKIDLKNKKIENEYDLESFFKIEEYAGPNFNNMGTSQFIWSQKNINNIRNENIKKGRLLNRGMPITSIERNRYKFLKEKKLLSHFELQKYFQRALPKNDFENNATNNFENKKIKKLNKSVYSLSFPDVKVPPKAYKIKIENLGLGYRSINCLKSQNIFNVGDLISFPETKLLKIDRLGRKSYYEIKDALYDLCDKKSLKNKITISSTSSSSIKNDFLTNHEDNIFTSINSLINERGFTNRKLMIFLSRIGADSKPKTLEVIGKQWGISRERVRQILARLLRNPLVLNISSLTDHKITELKKNKINLTDPKDLASYDPWFKGTETKPWIINELLKINILNKNRCFKTKDVEAKKTEEAEAKIPPDIQEKEQARIKEVKTEKQTRGVKDNGLIIKVKGFKELFFLAHKANIKSILEKGILSYNEIKSRDIPHVDFSLKSAQDRRHVEENIYGYNIHDYVPLLFTLRIPMLFSLKKNQDSLVILHIDTQQVLDENRCIFSWCNVASPMSDLKPNYIDDDDLYTLFKEEWWTDENKRQKASEVLIYPRIMPKYINSISCNSEQTKTEIMPLCKENNIPIKLNKELFF